MDAFSAICTVYSLFTQTMDSSRILFSVISLLIFTHISSFNFDNEKVSHINSGKNDSYFGYSILLQKGPETLVIIGAPKDDRRTGGAVYGCTLRGSCRKYSSLTVSNAHTFTGNFLGSVLDGGDYTGSEFITCAPRKVSVINTQHYLKGWCVSKNDSTDFQSSGVVLTPTQGESEISFQKVFYYDFAYGQVGFDVQLVKEKNVILYGAPGITSWAGSLVVQSTKNTKQYRVFPKQVLDRTNEYLGYAVTTAIIEDKRTVVAAGVPRANNLLGKVEFYENYRLILSLNGFELGSYFGSVLLAVDITGDGKDELFVGAPLGAGNTWDEGYVYFYTEGKNFNAKLTGPKKTGARFGTSIADLGDIDLDGYSDVAISAPYENEGMGAVYIYMGGKNGIGTIHAQRLSPLDFKGNFRYVRGFGLGMSKGNDIDGNGHNDLAVGAYKSDTVLIVKTLTVIDFTISLTTNATAVKGGDVLNITICVKFTKRSTTIGTDAVTFSIDLLLDYRSDGAKGYNETWSVFLQQEMCHEMRVTVVDSVIDLEPYKMVLNAKPSGEVFGKGVEKVERFLPYVHGCGDDNICQTKISLAATTEQENITIGIDKEISVMVTANNVGETGYQCQLYINTPTDFTLADKTNCRMENATDICSFATRLTETKEASYKFYVTDLMDLDQDTREITFKIKCLGVNLNQGEGQVTFYLHNEQSSYIEGKSEPENVFIREEDLKDEEITFTFTIGNYGPSPVKLHVYLLMPTIEVNDDNVFEFINAQGYLSGKYIDCHPSNVSRMYEKAYELKEILHEPLNRTIVMDCFDEGSKCLEIICSADHHLRTSSEVAEYTLKIEVRAELFSSKFKELLREKFLAYVPSALLYNATNRVEGQTVVSMYYSSQAMAIWVYILAVVLGLIILSGIILSLYKCNFFDRRYRDKLNDEKLLDQPIQTENNSDGDKITE